MAMRFIPGLAKRKVNNWINREWYHQRFDGSPYFMHFIAEGEIDLHRDRKKGGYFTVHYCFYDQGKADWYILMDDIKQVYTSIIKESRKNPDISSDLIKLWQNDQDIFYEKCIEIGNLEISKLSDQELINMHDEFARIALNKNSSSSIIDGFALGTDEMIADKIKKAYERSNIRKEQRFAEVFSVLTAPVHLSFINEAEVSLLRIADSIDKQGLRHRFKNNDAKHILDELKGSKSLQLIDLHQKEYFWIKNNYVSSYIITIKELIEEIKRLFDMELDIEKEIQKIENTPEDNKANKKQMIKNIEIDDELKTLIRISEDFTYWQDERKKSTLWNTHYFSFILDEIGKRVGIDLEDMKYMTCREVSLIFDRPPISEELKARRENGVYYWDEEGIDALHSKDADDVRQAILGKQGMSDVDDFRGLTACTGHAIGPVKIVKSATEIAKVNKGDILVAVMTRPDYVPAMKKASAIVTDEGGITSHAAIVSRELGVPCIIGTKIATKVLKENQMVEVNANHGWVKIIKQE